MKKTTELLESIFNHVCNAQPDNINLQNRVKECSMMLKQEAKQDFSTKHKDELKHIISDAVKAVHCLQFGIDYDDIPYFSKVQMESAIQNYFNIKKL